MDIQFSIWLASKTRWVHMTKTIAMLSVPRVEEYLKFRNEQVGDYFEWRVSQVTYRESGVIEVWTELLDNVEDRGYSFETEDEFDEYYQSYLTEGWKSPHGVTRNTRYQGHPVVDDGA